MSLQEFSQYIFDQYDISNVTVMFEIWLGIRDSRVHLQGFKPVSTTASVSIGLFPSKKMVADRQKYLEHVRQSGGKYFGITVRVQRAYLK